jgi:hypothetical protein
MRSSTMRIIALALTLALTACGDDNFSPTVENVAGPYTASTFTYETSEGTTDLLAAGAVVSIDLADDGTTTGEIFVAAGGEDGGDLDEDLTGTWTLAGSTVTFDQDADTFIRDLEFAADEGLLIGEDTFDDVTIRLVLSKTNQ